jgi:hypothetical protein
MGTTKSAPPPKRLDGCDATLVAAFILISVVGSLNSVLLVNDGAYFLSVAWLGDAWDLYFDQFVGRALSLLLAFGPVWALRATVSPTANVFLFVGHLLYFAAPLVLWRILRAVEPVRIYSRLYLAAMLALVYFPTELIAAAGLWMIWMALIAERIRSTRGVAAVTIGFALLLAFTHPTAATMSLLYCVLGTVLVLCGRPFPRHTLAPAAAMTVLLLGAYVATSHLWPSTNPTIIAMQGASSHDYLDPLWMATTLMLFPMLAALWLLLLAPGLETVNPRWRLPPWTIAVVGLLGLWFAANATSLYTYLFARHTVSHVLAVALALAVAMPAKDWLVHAHRPLAWCAAIATAAALSYNVDVFLFKRFVDDHLVPGVTNVDRIATMPWPRPVARGLFEPRFYFKWAAGDDYVRDVVVPDYERYRQVLAFVSFFRSDRQSVLFHRLPQGHWVPFVCDPVERAAARAHDEADRRFLSFLQENYCVR